MPAHCMYRYSCYRWFQNLTFLHAFPGWKSSLFLKKIKDFCLLFDSSYCHSVLTMFVLSNTAHASMRYCRTNPDLHHAFVLGKIEKKEKSVSTCTCKPQNSSKIVTIYSQSGEKNTFRPWKTTEEWHSISQLKFRQSWTKVLGQICIFGTFAHMPDTNKPLPA